jgi:hypothetical protein
MFEWPRLPYSKHWHDTPSPQRGVLLLRNEEDTIMYDEMITAFPEPAPYGEVLLIYPEPVYVEPEVWIGAYAPIYAEPVYDPYAPIHIEPVYDPYAPIYVEPVYDPYAPIYVEPVYDAYAPIYGEPVYL